MIQILRKSLPRHRDHESLFGADHVVNIFGRGVDIDAAI